MNRHLIYFLLATCLYATPSQSQTRDDYANLATKVSNWITNEQADSVYTLLDSVMNRRLTSGQISDLWQTVLLNYGPLREKGKMNIEQRDVYHVANQVFIFDRMKFRLTITFNTEAKIAGLYINQASVQHEVPNYVNTLSFVEYKLTFGKEPILLEGVLSVKKTEDKLPLVIMVQGSGPQDMDGTYGSNRIYKDIAWGIASHEIAVFRYPKRTSIYGSIYLSGNPNVKYTLEDEYVNDLILAIERLCKRPEIDTNRIFLFAHSQGGDAAIIAAKKSGKIKGILMGSTTPRKIQDLMCEQLDYINGYEPSYSEKRIKSDAMKQKLVYSLNPDLKDDAPFDSLPLNIAPSYWIYLNKFDAITTLKEMPDLKLYFLQGGRDYQVTKLDFGLWQEAFANEPRAEFKLYPKLNHMYFKGEARSTAAEYEEQHNVDESIVNDMVLWLKKNTK